MASGRTRKVRKPSGRTVKHGSSGRKAGITASGRTVNHVSSGRKVVGTSSGRKVIDSSGKVVDASSGRWVYVSAEKLRKRAANAAETLDGRRWPNGVTRAVKVRGKLYPARRVAVAATGARGMKPADVVRFFSKVGLRVENVSDLGLPEYAGTVAPMPNDEVVRTSDTPRPEVLSEFLGEWVAMAAGDIIDHDQDLTALVKRLNDSGVENDRLFRVPDELSGPVPATLG
jgi:hypothetical protein